jgi:hypothetical protein
MTSKDENPETGKTKDDFIPVARRCKQGGRRTSATTIKESPSNNQFNSLQ